MEDTMKEKKTGSSKKKGLFLGLAVLVIILIVIAILLSRKNNGPMSGDTNVNINEGDNITNVEGEVEVPDAAVDINSDDLQEVEVANLEGAKVVVPGANPITKDNKVVTEEGVVTDNTALPMAENAPRQTGFLNKDELSDGVVKLNVGDGVISPAQFSTSAGAPTTFSITGTDSYSHTIAFDDPAMTAIAILVGPGQTKAITFNAPATAGEYTFTCVSPGHSDKGETGIMIVN